MKPVRNHHILPPSLNPLPTLLSTNITKQNVSVGGFFTLITGQKLQTPSTTGYFIKF